jgi:hypothetical protein
MSERAERKSEALDPAMLAKVRLSVSLCLSLSVCVFVAASFPPLSLSISLSEAAG